MEIRQKEWGEEIVYIDEKEYAMKMLKIKKLKSTSLHYHPRKKETLYILKGKINIEIKKSKGCCSKFHRLSKQDTVTLSPRIIHRIIGIEDSIIIEVSTQPKDDTVRVN